MYVAWRYRKDSFEGLYQGNPEAIHTEAYASVHSGILISVDFNNLGRNASFNSL